MNCKVVIYKECKDCKKVLPEDDFRILKRKKLGNWAHLECRSCENKFRCSEKKRKKKQLVALLGGCCEVCGYNKCIEALDFHHRDPSEKKFGIARKLQNTWKVLLPEAKKCAVLCSNCHREFHAGVIEL